MVFWLVFLGILKQTKTPFLHPRQLLFSVAKVPSMYRKTQPWHKDVWSPRVFYYWRNNGRWITLSTQRNEEVFNPVWSCVWHYYFPHFKGISVAVMISCPTFGCECRTRLFTKVALSQKTKKKKKSSMNIRKLVLLIRCSEKIEIFQILLLLPNHHLKWWQIGL